MGYFLNLV